MSPLHPPRVVSSENLVIAIVAAKDSPVDLHSFRGLHPQNPQTMRQYGFHAAHQPEASLGQLNVVRDKAMFVIITMQLGGQFRQEISDPMRLSVSYTHLRAH